MIQYKTSVLLGGALKIGAVISDASDEDAEQLYQFGLTLGTSFQIKDDILDAFGDPEKFGKQVGGDILANKKTILLIKAQELANPEQLLELKKWLATDADETKVEAVKELYKSTGALDYAKAKMESYYQESLLHLHQIGVSEEQKKPFYEFADWLKNREV